MPAVPVTNVCGKKIDVKALSVALRASTTTSPTGPRVAGTRAARRSRRRRPVRLAGLTSWGADKCDSLGISMDVGAYSDFIDAAILNAPPQPNPNTGCCNGRRGRGRAGGRLGTYAIVQLNKEGHLRDEAASMINVDGPHGPGRLQREARTGERGARPRATGCIWAVRGRSDDALKLPSATHEPANSAHSGSRRRFIARRGSAAGWSTCGREDPTCSRGTCRPPAGAKREARGGSRLTTDDEPATVTERAQTKTQSLGFVWDMDAAHQHHKQTGRCDRSLAFTASPKPRLVHGPSLLPSR